MSDPGIRDYELKAVLRKVAALRRNSDANGCGTAVDYLTFLAEWLKKRRRKL